MKVHLLDQFALNNDCIPRDVPSASHLMDKHSKTYAAPKSSSEGQSFATHGKGGKKGKSGQYSTDQSVLEGLAAQGMRPFCAIYSTFLQRAYDQVVHDVAIQNLPVRFAIDRAGLVGADGATHAGSFDITYLASLPNMVVMAAADEAELVHMTYTAALHDSGPIAFRYPRGNGVGVELPEVPQVLEIGKLNIRISGCINACGHHHVGHEHLDDRDHHHRHGPDGHRQRRGLGVPGPPRDRGDRRWGDRH